MKIIISCGSKKLQVAAPAARLYIGGFFKTCLKFARSNVQDRDIRILSAKYGLLRLDQMVEPYEHRMSNRDRARLVPLLRKQMIELDDQPIWTTGGQDYLNILREAYPKVKSVWKVFDAEMSGSSMGYMISWMLRNPGRLSGKKVKEGFLS